MARAWRPITRADVEDMLGYERGALDDVPVSAETVEAAKERPLFRWISSDMAKKKGRR